MRIISSPGLQPVTNVQHRGRRAAGASSTGNSSRPAKDIAWRTVLMSTTGKSDAPLNPSPGPKKAKQVSRRQLIEMTSLGAFASTFCPCCDNIAKASEGGGVWDYTNPSRVWGGACSLGATQSPVDLPVRDGWAHENTKTLGPLVFKYGVPDKALLLANTQHGTMQVNFVTPADSKAPFGFEVKGKGEYDLLQYHFHTPSEHALNGYRTSMEAHLVHRNRATGTLAVVGVLLGGTQGDNLVSPLSNSPVDDLLEVCLDFAPSNTTPTSFDAGGGAVVSLWPTALVPSSGPPYVHYAGSLTTPPCTEGVDWFVLTNVVNVNLALVERFREFNANNGGIRAGEGKPFGNARPPQRPNNRMVDYLL